MSKEEIIKDMKNKGIELVFGSDHSSPLSYTYKNDTSQFVIPDKGFKSFYMGVELSDISKEDWDNA